MGGLTVGSIQDDFHDCGGQSATTKHIVNRRGLPIGDEQDGAKGVDVQREEEEDERVVR